MARGPSLGGERKLAPCRNIFPGVPAQISCYVESSVRTSVPKGKMWFTQIECIVKNPVCIFLFANGNLRARCLQSHSEDE